MNSITKEVQENKDKINKNIENYLKKKRERNENYLKKSKEEARDSELYPLQHFYYQINNTLFTNKIRS